VEGHQREAEAAALVAGRPKHRAREAAGLPALRGNGSWPQFGPGNEANLRHGAHRSELYLSAEPRTREIFEAILETQPVAHPADAGAAQRLAITYRRIEQATAAIEQVDGAAASPLGPYLADSKQGLLRLREDLARWLSLAGKLEAELGRTPASRAKLGLHIALGRRALTLAELHEAAAIEAEVEGDGDGD
jgi:hypothetical protein